MAFQPHDVVPDSPLNNFATLNPLAKIPTLSTFSNGNLAVTTPSTGGGTSFSTISIPSTGKWYCEVIFTDSFKTVFMGLSEYSSDVNFHWNESGLETVYYSPNYNGRKYLNSVYSAYGTTMTTGDVIGILADSAGSVTFYKNGVSMGEITKSVAGLFFTVADGSSNNYQQYVANFGQDPTFGGAANLPASAGSHTADNGIGTFAYQPPAGALALCTQNIPSGPIDIANDDVPSDYFKAVTYTGGGANTKELNLGFNPDLLWFKQRTDTGTPHRLMDTVRGLDKCLATQNTGGEFTLDYLDLNTSTNVITLKANTGVAVNSGGKNYVAWCWKAAGAPADNQARIIDTDGSLITKSTADLKTETGASITPSKVSANRKSGFSIVKYVGNSTNGATVSHGLSKKPEMIIVKVLDGGSRDNAGGWWIVKHIGSGPLSSNHQHYGFSTGQFNSSSSNHGYLTVNNSSTITLNKGSNTGSISGDGSEYWWVNTLSANYIMYAWHSVAGYSKFGSYVGTNTADNSFVECGFRPAWVMVKSYGTGGNNYDWRIYDSKRNPYNPVDNHLEANQSLAENGDSRINKIDFLSNGFKIRDSYAEVGSSTTYIFAAFAEQPFNAPATAR